MTIVITAALVLTSVIGELFFRILSNTGRTSHICQLQRQHFWSHIAEWMLFDSSVHWSAIMLSVLVIYPLIFSVSLHTSYRSSDTFFVIACILYFNVCVLLYVCLLATSAPVLLSVLARLPCERVLYLNGPFICLNKGHMFKCNLVKSQIFHAL